MAAFGKDAEAFSASRTVKIVATETVENYTVYVIQVTVGPYHWTIRHRYSQFFDLHEKLVTQYKLDKNLLPPKKLFGNQSEAFIRKRQGELEIYLQTVLHHLSGIPSHLANFLHFHKYEIHGLTQALAEELFHKGDLILQAGETFHITPLQLHAISSRLKLAEPTCETGDATKDLGHVLDFITQLRYLKIIGSNQQVGTSNIIMKELSFDMLSFKNLESLELHGCNCEMMTDVEHMKKTLTKLRIHKSIKAIKDVLLLGVGHGAWHGGEDEALIVPAWSALTSVDFSHNNLSSIDESVKMMPCVEYLDLSENVLEDVQHLQHLTKLTHVDLSNNHMHSLNSLHTKLGNITALCLAGNRLESLLGLSKLYSLESLDVSGNEISQVLEVRHISSLPCLENLTLTGNPVTIVVDYRTKILELFGNRATEVCLDGQKPSQKELDTVAILLAIQKSKETKERARKHAAKKPAVEAHITDSAPGAHGNTRGRDPSPSGNQETGRRSARPRSKNRHGGSRQSHLGVNRQHANTDSSSDDEEDSDTCSTVSVGASGCLMLPETLPGKNDSTFTSFLQGLVPNSTALNQQLRQGDERRREERAVHVMWCSVLCYTDPYKERPACIYVTTENLHVFYITSLRSAAGWPEMSLVYCMPLCNIQQMVIGYEELYLRLEEAFVGPQGTFTLLTYSPHKTRAFMDALKGAIRRAIPEGEPHEDPHLVWNGETEMSLKAVLNRVECLPDMAAVPLILYMLVQTLDVGSDKQVYSTHSLIITAKYLYIVREDYILWPQPTYGIGPSTRPQFEVLHSYPIAGRISGIQMYDTDSLSQTVEALPENFLATGSSINIMPNFIGFGVKLVFEMGQQQGTKDLDIRVPTSGMRDKFLATLTRVRRDMSERSPSPPKGKPTYRGKTREAAPTVDETRSDTSSHSSSNSMDRHSVASSVSAAYSVCSAFSQECNNATTVEVPIKEQTQSPCPVQAGVSAAESGDPQVEEQPESWPCDAARVGPPAAVSPTDAAADDSASAGGPVSQQPASLPLMYPTMDLLDHLTLCNEQLALLQPLSEGLRNLASMTGEELINYFHSQVALIGGGAEELSHLLWSTVTPYTAAHQEVATCILLSTKAIYFISDRLPKRARTAMPAWKTHNRHKSDSLIAMPNRDMDLHHSSGILLPGSPSSRTSDTSRVKAYFTLSLKELRQVNLGMFDQSFRLAGDSDSQVFTCVTRDNFLTEAFVKRLMTALSSVVPSPSPDMPSSDSEPDVYKVFGRCASRAESLEYVHASRVRFIYPSEDSVTDLTYLMVEHTRGHKPAVEDVKILLYLLLFQIQPSPAEGAASEQQQYGSMKPRTLIITNSHLSLAIEDHVSYPLPDFAKGLPESPNFEVTDVRRLEFLRRVIMSDFTSHDVTLVFADESEDIVVDLTREHYSTGGADVLSSTPVPEVKWTLIIQNTKDRDRLIKLLSRQWTEFHDSEELSVQVSA